MNLGSTRATAGELGLSLIAGDTAVEKELYLKVW